MISTTNEKYCQSCIERYGKRVLASREWQKGLFYCNDCFDTIVNNMTNFAPGEIDIALRDIEKTKSNGKSGPLLDLIYAHLNVPPELQFNRVDTICKNHDKFFNFAAPAIVNKTVEELASSIEDMGSVLFIVKFYMEPLQSQISKLKEEKRKENNLAGLKDSEEVYKKPKKATTSTEEKRLLAFAKSLNMTHEQAQEFVQETRIRDFRKLTGRCDNCGNSRHEGSCKKNMNETIVDEVKVETKAAPVAIEYKLTNELLASITGLERTKALMLIVKTLKCSLPVATKLYDAK